MSKQAMKLAEIDELREKLADHKAARIAYASEFPKDAEGEPDVGNIHANIRALKTKLAALEVLYLNSLADATQWQLYKSRKDAVIAAGMGKKAMRDLSTADAPTCTSDEWLANCPQSVRDWAADKIKAGAAPNVEWNKNIRDSVDKLLEQAGYAEDSSARHQLSMMNFDVAGAAPVQQVFGGRVDQSYVSGPMEAAPKEPS